MTAVGLLCIGVALAYIYLHPKPEPTSKLDYAVACLLLFGSALITIGLIVWAWRHLP